MAARSRALKRGIGDMLRQDSRRVVLEVDGLIRNYLAAWGPGYARFFAELEEEEGETGRGTRVRAWRHKAMVEQFVDLDDCGVEHIKFVATGSLESFLLQADDRSHPDAVSDSDGRAGAGGECVSGAFLPTLSFVCKTQSRINTVLLLAELYKLHVDIDALQWKSIWVPSGHSPTCQDCVVRHGIAMEESQKPRCVLRLLFTPQSSIPVDTSATPLALFAKIHSRLPTYSTDIPDCSGSLSFPPILTDFKRSPSHVYPLADGESGEGPDWSALPPELWFEIFVMVGASDVRDVVHLGATSQYLHSIGQDRLLWRRLFVHHVGKHPHVFDPEVVAQVSTSDPTLDWISIFRLSCLSPSNLLFCAGRIPNLPRHIHGSTTLTALSRPPRISRPKSRFGGSRLLSRAFRSPDYHAYFDVLINPQWW